MMTRKYLQSSSSTHSPITQSSNPTSTSLLTLYLMYMPMQALGYNGAACMQKPIYYNSFLKNCNSDQRFKTFLSMKISLSTTRALENMSTGKIWLEGSINAGKYLLTDMGAVTSQLVWWGHRGCRKRQLPCFGVSAPAARPSERSGPTCTLCPYHQVHAPQGSTLAPRGRGNGLMNFRRQSRHLPCPFCKVCGSGPGLPSGLSSQPPGSMQQAPACWAEQTSCHLATAGFTWNLVSELQIRSGVGQIASSHVPAS